MKKIVVLFLILFLYSNTFSQSNLKTYTWEDVKNANPDTVFSITFEKNKLDSIPIDLLKFTNLKKLDLSKNKLTHLPDSFVNLKKLETLDLGKNKFTKFPPEICKLTHLKKLSLNRNDISIIPYLIINLTELETLDIWDTPIISFPEEFVSMKNLKYIDARGVTHGAIYQKKWKEKLPWIKMDFDAPCNCIE
jgi:Leucine-rich repeat (LRR) protein